MVSIPDKLAISANQSPLKWANQKTRCLMYPDYDGDVFNWIRMTKHYNGWNMRIFGSL